MLAFKKKKKIVFFFPKGGSIAKICTTGMIRKVQPIFKSFFFFFFSFSFLFPRLIVFFVSKGGPIANICTQRVIRIVQPILRSFSFFFFSFSEADGTLCLQRGTNPAHHLQFHQLTSRSNERKHHRLQ